MVSVRSLRLGFARLLVAGVVGALCLVRVLVFVVSSSSVGLVLSVLSSLSSSFGLACFVWAALCLAWALLVRRALGVAAGWPRFGFGLVGCRLCSVVLLCSVFRCAVAAVSAAPCCRLFLLPCPSLLAAASSLPLAALPLFLAPLLDFIFAGAVLLTQDVYLYIVIRFGLCSIL